jgi:hypothetical protein
MKKIRVFLLDLFSSSWKTSFDLFKIMIPVSIMVAILEYIGAIGMFGKWLSPLAQMLGLPGEAGIVWATTLISNMYGGMISFASIFTSGSLSIAQVSILCNLMLVAHTFPVELGVARSAGLRLVPVFLLRFIPAILSSWLMFVFLEGMDWLQGPSKLSWKAEKQAATWNERILAEVERYFMVFLVVMALLLTMKFLKASGLLHRFTQMLRPLIRLLGMEERVLPITVIGMSMGILYGGGLMIQEAKTKAIDTRQLFYAFLLMGLCHSLIEDSLLMMALGADWSMVFLFRPIFALVFTAVSLYLLRRMPERFWYYLIRKPLPTASSSTAARGAAAK